MASTDKIPLGTESLKAVTGGGTDGGDWLEGGQGNDTLNGGSGHDLVLGMGGDDALVQWDDEGDIVDGGAGNDLIRAGSGGDDLFGGDGNDTVHGGGGNDTISLGTDLFYRHDPAGHDGDCLVYGEAGDDTVLWFVGTEASRSHFDGGAGLDTIKVEPAHPCPSGKPGFHSDVPPRMVEEGVYVFDKPASGTIVWGKFVLTFSNVEKIVYPTSYY